MASWLLSDMRGRLKRHFQRWAHRRVPPARQLVLGQRTIFILPNRQSIGFGVVLVLMLLGAINYEASLAFALVFLLAAMFLLSIFYTFRNLAGLGIAAQPGPPVFAGENATVTAVLSRQGKRQYEALRLFFAGSRPAEAELVEHTEARVTLYLPAPRRGRFSPGRLSVETVFPFGLCRAWSLVDLQLECLVYPAPQSCDLEWLLGSQQHSGKTHMNTGNDDFYGLREYQRGDSLRQVAWKHAARGQGLLTKQFTSQLDERLWLDWEMFPGMGTEERLSRLCYCVLQLEGSGLDYGLRLPGLELPPAKGNRHYERVLRMLALYGLPEPAGERAA